MGGRRRAGGRPEAVGPSHRLPRRVSPWSRSLGKRLPGVQLAEHARAAALQDQAKIAGDPATASCESVQELRVAGGAPLWLSSCVDGCPGLVNVKQWTVDSQLPKLPAKGTLLLGVETGRVYEKQSSRPVYLSACPAGGCGAAVRVNQSSIDALAG